MIVTVMVHFMSKRQENVSLSATPKTMLLENQRAIINSTWKYCIWPEDTTLLFAVSAIENLLQSKSCGIKMWQVSQLILNKL